MTDKEKELQDELDKTKTELERIKEGIKQCKITMIVDGNDMVDWGWLSIYDVNRTCRKRWGKGISEY